MPPRAHPGAPHPAAHPGMGVPNVHAARARAEELVRHGQIAEAIRIYRDLATRFPNDPSFWQRVNDLSRHLPK